MRELLLGLLRGLRAAWAGRALWKWELITRADADPYLWRMLLARARGRRLYLHVFVGSDDECLHDHPWPFWSLILWGGYWEDRPAWGLHPAAPLGGPAPVPPEDLGRPVAEVGRGATLRPGRGGCVWSRWYGPGRLLRRPARWAHRVVLGRRRAVTLVLTGTKERQWGFWTPGGWRPWKEYSHREHCGA